MKSTFASFTFGCRVNEAEKIVLDKKMAQDGFSYSEKNPEYYIINSCAITQKAEREAKQYIYQIRKKIPDAKIIITGCAATRWLDKKEHIKEADMLIPNAQKDNLVQLIKQLDYEQKKNRTIRPTNDKFLRSGRVMIKIQDGCARFCSFCIVPYLRGKPSSRSIREIVEEIKSYGSSVREAVLTGINTEYFGISSKETIPMLLDAILQETGIPRISFGSINPWSIDDNFIAWYKKNANNRRFAHFFHIPVQSASNHVLKLMNRGVTQEQLRHVFSELHTIDQNAFFGTDVIVGFPGETPQDFQETYDFLSQSPISKFHIFRYSARSGTFATKNESLWGAVMPKMKINRSKRLIELGVSKLTAFIDAQHGTKGDALFLKPLDTHTQEALFSNQLLVQVAVNSPYPNGTMKKVMLYGTNHTHALARIV